MLADYTYVMHMSRREKDKKGQIKEETITYEVYIPTLKSGLRTRGVLLVTSRNGVPVPPNELEKERLRTGERLEKEEHKIARQTGAQPGEKASSATGMLPLGMYARVRTSRDTLGIRRGGAILNVHTFLRTCALTLLRREEDAGRERLILSFSPRPDAQYGEDEKYLARLKGELWITLVRRKNYRTNAGKPVFSCKLSEGNFSRKVYAVSPASRLTKKPHTLRWRVCSICDRFLS
jgi:hypothetical protein